LRSLSEHLGWRRPTSLALASGGGALATLAPQRVLLRGERARRGFWRLTRFNRPAPRGLGFVLAATLMIAAAAIGAVRGGKYQEFAAQEQEFAAQEGAIGDFLARGLGFGVKAVKISGQSRLSEPDVLALGGITPKISLPFFDVEAARARLEAAPLISHASVRKLYPGEIVIEIEERTPAGLWQRDGEVKTVAADGAVIDELGDHSSSDLPFVVGAGANERLSEFLALLDASQELRAKIAAGVLIGERRWNLKMKSGLDVKLPEADPAAAVATLVKLQRESRILDRDLLWLDLRTPGRVFARLSVDAAAARQERLDAHVKKGAGP
jgi:cell division protein FtsQ